MAGAFSETHRTVSGVDWIVKAIPGESRTGVLSPEQWAECTNEGAAQRGAVMRSGDLAAIRAMTEYTNQDLTTTAIDQWEITVEREGYAIPVTVCAPAGRREVRPAVIYMHGGAWRFCSRRCTQNQCRLIAEQANAVVFNVEYRLAPEWRYPVGIDDADAVLQHVVDSAADYGIDPTRIAVAGDSAGGNLAAVLAHRDRNSAAHRVAAQMLFFPGLSIMAPDDLPDYCFSLDDYDIDPSQRAEIEALVNTIARSRHEIPLFLVDSEAVARSADVSPLYDTDFSGLPKTLLICAEYDYLTTQGYAYAARLRQAGVSVQAMLYRGVGHSFVDKLGAFPQSADALCEAARFLEGI